MLRRFLGSGGKRLYGCIMASNSSSNMFVSNQLREMSGVSGGRVKMEKEEELGLAVITLDNPLKKNALNADMISDLSRIVDELERWEEGKGVILWGGSDYFCAGADINMLEPMSKSLEDGVQMTEFMQGILGRLLHLPMLSVSLVTGSAMGGGAELMSATDFRLVAENAFIQFVHLRMGVVPGWGAGRRLVDIVGTTTALDILTSTRRVSAEEAVRLGLASQVLSSTSSGLLEEAKSWLLKRTDAQPQVIRAMKRLVRGTAEQPTYQQSMKVEREEFARVWAGPALEQAINKFKSKS